MRDVIHLAPADDLAMKILCAVLDSCSNAFAYKYEFVISCMTNWYAGLMLIFAGYCHKSTMNLSATVQIKLTQTLHNSIINQHLV